MQNTQYRSSWKCMMRHVFLQPDDGITWHSKIPVFVSAQYIQHIKRNKKKSANSMDRKSSIAWSVIELKLVTGTKSFLSSQFAFKLPVMLHTNCQSSLIAPFDKAHSSAQITNLFFLRLVARNWRYACRNYLVIHCLPTLVVVVVGRSNV